MNFGYLVKTIELINIWSCTRLFTPAAFGYFHLFSGQLFYIKQTFCHSSRSLSTRMSSYHRLSCDERVQILTLPQEGTSNHEIAMRVGVRRATVKDFLHKYQTTGRQATKNFSKRWSGRITRSSIYQALAVSRSIQMDFIQSGGPNISAKTVCHRFGYWRLCFIIGAINFKKYLKKSLKIKKIKW